jgi:hypothetical protein
VHLLSASVHDRYSARALRDKRMMRVWNREMRGNGYRSRFVTPITAGAGGGLHSRPEIERDRLRLRNAHPVIYLGQREKCLGFHQGPEYRMFS